MSCECCLDRGGWEELIDGGPNGFSAIWVECTVCHWFPLPPVDEPEYVMSDRQRFERWLAKEGRL